MPESAPHPAAPPPPADVVLRDGSTVHVRPAAEADFEALAGFLSSLSEQSRLFRFFGAVDDLTWAARTFLDIDLPTRVSLLAVRDQRIVGHGFYAQDLPHHAEVALAIADDLQGLGLGTLLLGHLAAYAAAAGIDTFTADVLPENHRMLGVFRASGFRIRGRSASGVLSIEFPTSRNADLDRFERRDQLAAIAALRRFLEPRSIAVVGASRQRGKVGGEVFHNLLTSGFPGPVYPVSPHPVVHSVAAYPNVGDIPGAVDLVIVATPAREVIDVVRHCAEKGVQAVVVLSAGFAEAGAEGVQRQRALVEVCRDTGVRMVGPNSIGICSTASGKSFNATPTPRAPLPGRVGFLSQSGSLALAVIEHTRVIGLGLSQVVSVGNKADISGNDLLEYWEDDPDTDAVILYLESFGNPRRFSRLARRVARQKPILVVKSARTAAGARASSTSGALLDESDGTVEALFRQSGVIRAESLGDLLDIANLLDRQPPPSGPRVGILTNAGGLGILCADSCVGAGLDVPDLSAGARERMRRVLPAAARLQNPVDVSHEADPQVYEQAVRLLAGTGEFDALIVLFIPPLLAGVGEVIEAIERAAREGARGLPVLGVFAHRWRTPGPGHQVPRFEFPEDAARALARVYQWQQWRESPEEAPWRPAESRTDEARAILAGALGGGPHLLAPEATEALLGCYGISLLAVEAAADPDAVAEIAARRASVSAPLVLRAVGGGISDRG
ncbi:MAG: GNAT family N-acetyltransferase, partial [Candidatus Dormibacteraceae bacterium]